MTTPTPEPHKLTGRRRGWWYVVAFAGQRDGVNLWHCICGRHEIERIIPEPKLLNRKTNSLDQPCRCKGWVGRLSEPRLRPVDRDGAYRPRGQAR